MLVRQPLDWLSGNQHEIGPSQSDSPPSYDHHFSRASYPASTLRREALRASSLGRHPNNTLEQHFDNDNNDSNNYSPP